MIYYSSAVCSIHGRVFFLFFFKQKTAYEMRISDWSSDVCSSDLRDAAQRSLRPRIAGGGGNEQTGNEALEVETAIETPSSLAEVTFGVLELTNSVEGAIARAFAVSHPHVDPARAIGRSEPRRVGTACVGTCRSRWSSCKKKK